MAKGNFTVEIPITSKSKGTGLGDLAKDFTKGIKDSMKGFIQEGKKSTGMAGGIGKDIGKIAASVGIVAAIWQGIAPILTPVLKLFQILLTLLLIPLMPLIKQMVSGLANTASKVGEAQQAAGGTGMAAFAAGLGEVVKSPTIWAFAGAAIALSFVSSLVTGGLLGAVALTIGLGLVFTSIGEDEVKNKVGAAGLIGLSAGIAAAVLTGNPIAGTLVGVVSFALAMKFLPFDSISMEDIKNAIMSAGIAALVAAGLAGFFFGFPAFVLVGTLTFALSLIFDLSRKKDPFKDLIEKEQQFEGEFFGQTRQFVGPKITEEMQQRIDNINFGNFTEGINETNTHWIHLNSTMGNDIITLNSSLDGLGKMIGNRSKGSFPLVYSLIQAENEWENMQDVSSLAINNIITDLDRIPRTITTTHIIRTVRI